MIRPAWRCVGLLLLAFSARAIGADDGAERERIRKERADVETQFTQSERACYEKIVVSSCLDAARATRREAMARLRTQEIELNEAQRKHKAAQKEQSLNEKSLAKEGSAKAAGPSASAPPAEKPAPKPATPRPPREPKPVPSASQRAAQEAAAKAAYEAKQREAEAHRLEVARRNEEHARKTKPATPLPIPAASAP